MTLAMAAAVGAGLGPGPKALAAGPCGPPITSVIACENSLPGSPASQWDPGTGADTSIVGFSTDISVNLSGTIRFKISTAASGYTVDIYRIGYYQGNGARRIGSVTPIQPPQKQPACLSDATTGLIDCGNWSQSASWTVPSTAVSGVYEALLTRTDTHGTNQIPFVVRNDASTSDLLYQTSDTTWQAYNAYGGNSLYVGNPAGRAYKVSYNRPFTTRESLNAGWDTSQDFFFYDEYPTVRFLEANGYDVSYSSGLDSDRNGALIKQHRVFVSAGHDEYWSGQQRANVEAARDAGVSLIFISGNEVFWKTRWEPSIDGTATPYRTLVTYKETHADAPIDPKDPPTWTGTWRDPRFSPPADGGRPENSLTGQDFIVNAGTSTIKVPSTYSKLRFWRNSKVAALGAGQTLTMTTDDLGYEWDTEVDNGFRPAGLFDLSSTTVSVPQAFTDYGNLVGPATVTHHLSLYRAPSGALVFGAGTVQWSWGLDANHDGSGGAPDEPTQQAMINVLADMNSQPATLISGLVAATRSTDSAAPTSTITSPTPGATFSSGAAVTITGTAVDSGGGVVAGVEVSTDNGATWHPATGTTAWSYTWPAANASSTTVIRSRAVDDSGNLELAAPGVSTTSSCPCSIWGNTFTPAVTSDPDASATEVGVKFRSDAFGTITGIRFYKGTQNTGTHTGNLWSSTGTNLASAVFSGESASGWQQVNFATPIPIQANTTYIASYFDPNGHYSDTDEYFYPPPSPAPLGGGRSDNPPLHALRNGVDGANGVYQYSGSSTFPSTSSGSAVNYWVDVVFAPGTAPGTPGNVTASSGYSSAMVSWTAPVGSPASYTVTPYVGSTPQPATTVTGSPPPTSALVTGLTNGTAYTFTVTASNPVGTSAPSAPSAPVTPSASASTLLNGSFESGLSGWATGGVQAPVATSAKAHTGTASALLGSTGSPEPNGDSSLSQQVSVPPGPSTLSFWYWGGTNGDTIAYDWQEAQIRNTSGTALASVLKVLKTSTGWTQVVFDTTAYAGQTVVIWFNVHQDGSQPADQSWMYLDDVSVAGSAPTAPGAPTGIVATAGNGLATVSWGAPSNGGSPITSYTLTPFIGATPQAVTVVSGTPPATSTTVAALTNGTAYTFTVAATNSVSTGPASAPSAPVTPTAPTAPGAPTAVNATAGNGVATVTWAAPANGGSPITSYTVTPFVGSTAQAATPVTGSPPATTATVTGLTNGTAYTFTVAATNSVNTGPASAPSAPITPTAPTAPGAPTAVSATAGNTSATVTWAAPANGGSPITSYTVTPFIGSTAQTATAVTGSPPATSTTIAGLINGTAYTFTVTAANSVGSGPASIASAQVTPGATGVSIERSVAADGNGTVVSPAFSTAGSADLLVAFVASDGVGVQTVQVSGAGLTWTLVKRTNAQGGTSEVWSARAAGPLSNVTVTSTQAAGGFDQSLTVIAFAGASAIGATASASAAAGAPTVSLTATKSGSWMFAVGNDYDRAVARTVPSGQTIAHQWVDTGPGDTFWTQSTTTATGVAGSSTRINDTAPTGDRWNLAAVEILP